MRVGSRAALSGSPRTRENHAVDATTLAGLVLPGLATTVGGLGVLAFPRPGDRLVAALLGFTGGVMLAASVFSLLVPALDRGALWEVLTGFALGAAVIAVLDAGRIRLEMMQTNSAQ